MNVAALLHVSKPRKHKVKALDCLGGKVVPGIRQVRCLDADGVTSERAVEAAHGVRVRVGAQGSAANWFGQ
jgi:hypothetical protein